MMRDDYMGEVGNMVVANGLSQLYTGARDVDPFSAFDGVMLDEGVQDIEFSEFRTGASRRSRRRVKRSAQPRQRRSREMGGSSRRSSTSSSGETRRSQFKDTLREINPFSKEKTAARQKTREQEAQQQKELIAQAQKGGVTAETMNAILAQSTVPVSTTPTTSGMKPAVKWGLIIGGVAAAGIIGYVIYKRMKNKG